jgi:hypothetical protein
MSFGAWVIAAGCAAAGFAGQQASPARTRIVFAPPKHGAYVLSYDKSEQWDYGDRKGTLHVAWTMRDVIATVTKKGRVMLDGEFQSVDYSVHASGDGAEPGEGFRWLADGGFRDDKGDAVEKVGKKEIPKGLHLILDDRGAAEHGEC